MASSTPPRRASSRDRRKSLLRVKEHDNDENAEDISTKVVVRLPIKKASERRKKVPATKGNDMGERVVAEPKVEDFFEDVGNTIENRGPILQQNPLTDLVPVDQIGVVPIRDNGKRMLKYIYNEHTRWVELPTPRYGRSLGDILPAEIQREPWMELVRHPLTWDGIERKWLSVGPTQLIFENIPKKVTQNWKTSVESVGMHWFEDYPVTQRPPYQMSLLFRVAILGSPYQTLGSYDIVEILMAKFPWYNANRFRERTSTSAVQRSRDLNAYWVDQISNMSSKSTNRTWLDKHPFLARMTRGAKGHFWRLQDVPAYRIPAGKLPVYAVLALPPGTVMAPLDTSKTHEMKEEDMPRIWDRDSQSPSIVDSVEIFEYREPVTRSVIMGSHSVEQNSSGEDEIPDEDDEIPSQPHVPLYMVYKGMIATQLPRDDHFMNSGGNGTALSAEQGLPPPLVTKMDVSSEPITPHESPNMETLRMAEDARQRRGISLKAQREDLLMELVEFALDMDSRKPRVQENHSLMRCSSETVIPRERPTADRGTLRRSLSTIDKQKSSNHGKDTPS